MRDARPVCLHIVSARSAGFAVTKQRFGKAANQFSVAEEKMSGAVRFDG
jgi:hypothetical protein